MADTNTSTGSEGVAAAAPSAVSPAPAATPAAASAPKAAAKVARAKPAPAPAAAPAAMPVPVAATAAEVPTSTPAGAFTGLPQGQAFRRVGGRLVPVNNIFGTVPQPGATATPGAAAATTSPLQGGAPAAARKYNPLFMAPLPEDAQAKATIGALKAALQMAFTQLEHAVAQAAPALAYLTSTPTAAAAVQAEGIDLDQVRDFITQSSALLDHFAPPVAPAATA